MTSRSLGNGLHQLSRSMRHALEAEAKGEDVRLYAAYPGEREPRSLGLWIWNGKEGLHEERFISDLAEDLAARGAAVMYAGSLRKVTIPWSAP